MSSHVRFEIRQLSTVSDLRSRRCLISQKGEKKWKIGGKEADHNQWGLWSDLNFIRSRIGRVRRPMSMVKRKLDIKRRRATRFQPQSTRNLGFTQPEDNQKTRDTDPRIRPRSKRRSRKNWGFFLGELCIFPIIGEIWD